MTIGHLMIQSSDREAFSLVFFSPPQQHLHRWFFEVTVNWLINEMIKMLKIRNHLKFDKEHKKWQQDKNNHLLFKDDQ